SSSSVAVVVAVCVVIRSSFRLFLSTIQHHTEQFLFRHLVQKLVDCRVTSLAGPDHQDSTISALHQHACVREDAERRRVDDDVVEHATHFAEYASVAWTGKQFGNVVARTSARQKVKTRWFETNDRVFES